MRMLAQFEKRQAARYVSHLDLQNAFGRALRRAELPIAYSQGFNPHPVLSFAAAPPVGLLSRCEVMDVKLAGDISPTEFITALNQTLPEGLHMVQGLLVDNSMPAPMGKVFAAEYEVLLPVPSLPEIVSSFLAKDEVLMSKRSKSGEKIVNIRPLVLEMTTQDKDGVYLLFLRLAQREVANLRPDLLLRALTDLSGIYLPPSPIWRTALLLENLKPLFSFYHF